MSTLQQVLLEEKYNRKALRAEIMLDVTSSDFGEPYDHALYLLAEWRQGEYYDSKQDRIRKLGGMTNKALIDEAIAACSVNVDWQPIQAVSARLANQLDFDCPFAAVTTASEIIAIICHADLVDIVPPEDSENGSLMVRSKFQLDYAVQKAIEVSKYLPPMIVAPRIVTGEGNKDNSHYTFQDSLILGKHHHHEEHICVDVINLANQTKLSLDTEMVQYEETSSKPLDTPDKIKQFNKMVEDSLDVYNEILAAGNEFHLTWKYDFRGRINSQGYHINIQSTGYKKSLINLAKKEVITLD